MLLQWFMSGRFLKRRPYCVLSLSKETPDWFRRTNQVHWRKKKTQSNKNVLGRKVKFTEKMKSKKTSPDLYSTVHRY